MQSDDDNLETVKKTLSAATVVFWDFDGVIKDSLAVKADAFESLFTPYGQSVAKRVRQHHEAHGGMSRFDKIPLYLAWAGERDCDLRAKEFCTRFSKLVFQAVIDSPWIAGVPEYLQQYKDQQYFILVTATPQSEVQKILDVIGISSCFREVHGAPKQKSDVIRDVRSRLKYLPHQALMVGDAESDLIAAKDNGIPVLLRRTNFNQRTQATHAGPMFRDLLHG